MRLSVAQTRPIVGPVERNLNRHQALIELAVSYGAQLIVFPELSLTGYEPTRAMELARTEADGCFDVFQAISDNKQISVGVGVPIRDHEDICISMLLFEPRKTRQMYSKVYLHPDEEQFFTSKCSSDGLIGKDSSVALAICYEPTVPEHAANAFKGGAAFYIASVAKTAVGVADANRRLEQIARDYSMTVLMSNCLGMLDGGECVGGSAAWDSGGNLLARLDDANEGLIVVDSETGEVAKYVTT